MILQIDGIPGGRVRLVIPGRVRIISSKRVSIEGGDMVLNGLRGLDLVSIFILEPINFVSHPSIEGVRVEKFVLASLLDSQFILESSLQSSCSCLRILLKSLVKLFSRF